ncbi:cytochrome P450 [Punctularia strigosozonata HHB-11173 SS5]|uniref:cytochrome P450 n=1 Tax=Punctularia strigosozonata (strain HHB-11173) TaxID=741275 RepID=UPI00044170E5|nr:cytochrome P450 [Punctularia strigosozonata HHB-11173 SS5]EIN09810.1 cytochrome P450 [Punctularia strigosozonata HHB-11173 SS5]
MPLWGLYTWFSSHKVVRLEQESNTLVIRGLPFVGSIDFALDPYRYIRNLRATFPSSWIRFTICGVHIVLPAGDVAKKGPGLQRMFVKNRHSGSHDSAGPFLRQFMRTEAIESQIVPTIKALSETLEQWGESGIIDPFEMYPKIVFRIGLRIALGSEAADDEDTVTYAMHAFRWLNESAQPHSLLFPLIPTPSRHPEWHMKVNAEISQFVSRNCPGSSHLTAEALGTIGLSAWESELPILESCIQETVRLVAIGALPRRNTGSDLTVEGHTIRSGDFVLLMTEEANLDEEIYEHPQEFKPDRDLSKAEAKPLASLGWGYGNYACPGQRFAKTLLKVGSPMREYPT